MLAYGAPDICFTRWAMPGAPHPIDNRPMIENNAANPDAPDPPDYDSPWKEASNSRRAFIQYR